MKGVKQLGVLGAGLCLGLAVIFGATAATAFRLEMTSDGDPRAHLDHNMKSCAKITSLNLDQTARAMAFACPGAVGAYAAVKVQGLDR